MRSFCDCMYVSWSAVVQTEMPVVSSSALLYLAMFAEGKRTLRMRQSAIPTAELLPAALPELSHARDFCNCCRQPRERFQMNRPLVRDRNSPSLSSSILLLTHTLMALFCSFRPQKFISGGYVMMQSFHAASLTSISVNAASDV